MSAARLSRAALLAAASAASACSIPLSDLESGPVNTCDSSDDCAGGAVCASVGVSRACVATTADLPGLVLEIRPPADSVFGANVSYLVDLAEQGVAIQEQTGAAAVYHENPALPELASFDGRLRVGGGASYCGVVTEDGSYPAEVELRRVSSFLGLPDQSYPATAEVDALGGHRFHLDIPAGNYDVYVVPDAPADCTAPPPPIFLPNLRIAANTTSVDIDANAPRRLQGDLHVPQMVSVDGWSIEVVESKTGSVISNVQVLDQLDLQLFASFDINFDWTDTSGVTPLIRLRPPSGDPRPTVHWDLSALALQGSTENVNLSLSELDAVPRHVEGQVLDVGGHPVIAFVRIQSAEISGDVTATAAYKLDTETDENGVFRADLPPGEYRVFARPVSDTTKAIGQSTLKFDAALECFCGQSVTTPPTSTLRGAVAGPNGELMDAAYVVATPSVTGTTIYLDRVLALDPLPPRESSTSPFGGSFSLGLDPGDFDVSIRPPDGSLYPWLVRSRLNVLSAETTPFTDIGALNVSNPAVLQGVIRAPSGTPLPGTVVRAWLPVHDPSGAGKAAGVLQIGETLAGSDGAYVLPLPPSISE